MSNEDSAEDFAAEPVYMAAMQLGQDSVFTAITTAYSVITPGQLSSFSSAIGPLGVPNVIPAFFASTGSNVTGGIGTAVNHALLGVSTEVAKAGYINVDNASGGESPTTAL